MAIKHVKQYYLQIQEEYLEMRDNVEELKELMAEGSISEEECQVAIEEMNKVKVNYENLAYFILLLNKPKRKDANEDEITKSWYDALSGVSKEAYLDESKDALAVIKKLIKEGEIRNESRKCK